MKVSVEERSGLSGLLSYTSRHGDLRQQLVHVLHSSVWRIRVRVETPLEVREGARATLLLEDDEGLLSVPVRVSWNGPVTGLRVLAVRPQSRVRFRRLLRISGTTRPVTHESPSSEMALM